jgi:hypothetical protein
MFSNVTLKVGPIVGNHDMILGTPFLSAFNLSVSISRQSLHCDTPIYSISDYRCANEMNTSSFLSAFSTLSNPYPCRKSERVVLKEFEDLFPIDIPAVTDDTPKKGGLGKTTFPTKIQDKTSKVRHKIILTDPNTIVNGKQYPYPQKHLVAWRTLLDQHLTAGRIFRSSRQYASPSLIIPKKDTLA